MRNFTLLTLLLFFAIGATKANPDNPPKANTEPDFEVKAYYYPDSRYEHSGYVRVLWGSSFYDFETQDQDPFYASGWINDTVQGWTVAQPQIPGYHGNLCLMSGNGGVESSTSSIELSVYFVQDGSISFLGGCYGEGDSNIWDACEFYIDDSLQFKNGALQSWDTYSFDVSAGTHVFKWSYTKDGSVNALGDAFFVDDVTLTGVSHLGEPNSSYNVYLQPFDPATGGGLGNPTKIAENVTGNQFIVEDWAELEEGYYQFGIENPELTTTGIFWSNALNKSTVDFFTVTVTAYPDYAGTVTGGGTFTYGEICTLKATPNDRYSFSHWSDTLIGYNPECTFSVKEDVNIQAIFEGIPFYYSIYAEPYQGGEVEIVGLEEEEEEWAPIHYGDTITLKATPNAGYSFIKWTAEGGIGDKSVHDRGLIFLSDSTTCSVILNDDFLDHIFDDYIFDGDTIEGMGDGAMIIFVATFEEGIDGCMRPKKLTNTEVGPDFATFSWNERGEAESWYIFYHDATPTPAAPEDLYVQVNENPCTIWNLQPATTYEAYVVPSCGVEDGVPNSYLISDTIRFTTLGPCPTPLHVEVESVTGSTATVKWMDYSDSYFVQTGLLDLMLYENFNNGITSNWVNDTIYPWTVMNGRIQSSNGGMENSSSTISVTVNYTVDGVVEFDAECWGEGSGEHIYDKCIFSIDGENYFTYGADVEGWKHYSFSVPEGEHTFTWSYTKDDSVDPNGDYFAVDNVLMKGDNDIEWNDSLSVEEAHCTLTGLIPLTSYAVHVKGICEDEETEWSNLIYFTTNDVLFITASVNPTGAGTVTGAGEYHLGDSCTLVATANTGYTFANWTKGGRIYSDEATFSFTVSEDAEFVANFNQIEYYLSLSPVPQDGGSAEFLNDSTQVFHYGDAVSIHATPNQGYSFVNWTVWKNNDEVELSTNPTYNFTIGGDNPVTSLYPQGGQISLIAKFEIRNLNITVTSNPVAGGTVLVSDTVFNGGTFAYGDILNMKAVANEGYTFQNWTKNDTVVSSSAEYNFTVTATADFVANFQLNQYEITATANPTNGGTITGAGTYYYGTTVTLTATANTGYTFSAWSDGVTDNPRTDTVTGPASYEAVFTLNSYQITATANPTNGGTITGAGTYNYGTTVTLTATANTGYTFSAWSDGITDNPRTDTVTGPASYVANFTLNSYDISAMVSVNPANGGTVNGTGTYNYGETCNLEAVPATGFHFVKWTKNGEQVSTSPNYSFTVTGEDVYVAYFEINTYAITATANPTIGGAIHVADTIFTGGTFDHNTQITMVAVPAAGHTFQKWTKNGTQVSTNASYNITVTEAADYVAHFTLNSYDISAMVSVNPTNGGSVNGTGTYNYGETCNLEAVPATGFHFVKWTKNGEQVSTSPTYSFTVTGEDVFVAYFEINTYAITATANPTDGGAIHVADAVFTGGTFDHNTQITMVAVPATGYDFVKWTKNGTQVSTNASYNITVTEEAAYVAHFQLKSYTITATANPTAGGTVTGANTYNHFATCTLTATPATGYHFVKWTKNGAQVSTSASYSFEVTAAAAYVAHFELNSYAITATANPTAGGTITGANTYNHFETCSLTATPSEGYHFVNWKEGNAVVSTNATYSFEVTGERTLVANFELNNYAITATANPTEGGTITGAGNYNHFATCTLTATPATGYEFVKWTKNGTQVSTNATYSFEVTGAASYVAHFQLKSYSITATANPTAGGTITGAGTYNHFATCSLTATPATGYHFVKWTKNGTQVSTNASFSFEVNGAASYVAHFELNSYAITATANPTAGGTVTGANTYNHFETCTLTATPATGYEFVKWTKNGTQVSTNATYSFEVTGAASYVAHFQLKSYSITATANPTAGGTITGAGTYNHFATCSLTATPATGYHFVKWTKNGTQVSTNATYSFEVTSNASYVAHFELNSYAITATANPTNGGSITGVNTYNHFETCTLTATPATGYHFVNWTENGTQVSTSASYSFEVTGARTLVANFEINGYTITAMANPTAGGTVTGAGSYNHFETCTLTATPNAGYYFVRWTKGSEIVSTEAEYSFEVTETATYKAHFAKIAYAITAEANPEEGGTITGTGESFYYNTTCQLKATANTGYHFVNWTKDGVEVSTNRIYNFTVTESAHYVANFELDTFIITASVDPEEGGSVTGAGTYNYGETVTLTAEAKPDYQFVNWTEGDAVVSEEATLTFEVDSDRQLVAHFISTWGIIDHDALKVSIYPNPATYKLTIEASEPVNTLEIYNINGALVSKQKNCSDKIEIYLESYAAGTYMIRLTTASGVEMRKFVKE